MTPSATKLGSAPRFPRSTPFTDAKHYSDEKLGEGAIFRVNKPGTEIHGKPVLVHRVDSHPGFQSVGIAWARTEGG